MCIGLTQHAYCSRRAALFALRAVAVALVSPMMLAAMWSTDVRAQPSPSDPPPARDFAPKVTAPTLTPTLTAKQLKARLDSLRRELNEERAALAASKQRFEKEAAALAQERKELADRLLAAEIERQQSAAKLQSLRSAGGEAAASAQALSQQAASLAAALRAAVEPLRLHLAEVPGSVDEVECLRSLAAKFAWPLAQADFAASSAALDEFLAICDAAHRQATSVDVAETEIFTASGQREPVKLLSVGAARFAYVAADNRVGISLSSPAEAAGYRWTENVDAETQSLVRAAIEQCQSDMGGADGIVAIPLDPTGRLSVDAASSESSVRAWFVAGGPVMIPLACVAFAALVLIVERAVFYFAGNPGAEKLALGVLAACRVDAFHDAEQLCSQRRGVVARVMAACLASRVRGQRAMEDAVQEQLLHDLPKLQRFLGALATLAGVAPLLGLLGTVTGIIQTFSVIRSFGNTNPSLMAGGISEALITTALGLLVAVPVVIVHSLLRARCDRIVADAERHAATLLMTLVHGSAAERQRERQREPQHASHRAPPEPQPRSRSGVRAANAATQPAPTVVRPAVKEATVDR